MADVAVSALYYPHSAIKSDKLLKAALLLWDQVECIVPRGEIPATKRSRDVTAAIELVVRPLMAPHDARQRVHDRIAGILENGVPSWLRANAGPRPIDRYYPMYADKLLDETWRMLRHHDLAEPSLTKHERDFTVPPALGLLVLAMLADECAGVTRTKVTDRERAYEWLFGAMTTEMGGEYLPALDASHLAESYDRLVTASVRIVNTDGIPLRRLVRVRKRFDAELRPLRRKYLERVAAQVKAMVAPNVTARDKQEILRVFEKEMREDFKDLKQELGFATKDVIFSKEIGITALAVAGAAFIPASWPVVAATLKATGVGALLKTHNKYKKARKKALKDHAMSWLYAVT